MAALGLGDPAQRSMERAGFLQVRSLNCSFKGLVFRSSFPYRGSFKGLGFRASFPFEGSFKGFGFRV